MFLPTCSRLSVGVAAMLLVCAGCASSSKSARSAPSLPQPPSVQSVPSAPKLPAPPTPPTTAAGSEAGKGQKGEASGQARKAGQTDEAKQADGSQPGDKAGDKTGQADPVDAGGGQPVTAGGQTAGGALTPDEQRDGLDRQLQTSMAEFDAVLLREQQLLQEKQGRDPLPERGGGSGGTGSGEAGGTAQQQATEGEAADNATGGSQAGGADAGTPVTAPVEGGATAGDDASRVPPDVGDGKGDDVVARQLREAAMKEKDPGIREKLWQEYRDYKKGTGKD